jgi:hypothetical protein
MSSQVFHSKNEELEGERYKILSAQIAAAVKSAQPAHIVFHQLQGERDCLQNAIGEKAQRIRG